MPKKDIICLAFLFISMGSLIFFGNKYQDQKKALIDNNKFITVAKVFDISYRRSFTDARFYFYFNGVKYESGKHIDNSGKMYINKYYKVEIASIKPEYSRILLDHEVIDSMEIVNAGFNYLTE
ncbi:hypothetical protein [Flavobacterium sp.]|uniref:hypothetical protein n=1 Tax=Flavobacterium sp. TaxID=239 RepID=UPI0031E108D4